MGGEIFKFTTDQMGFFNKGTLLLHISVPNIFQLAFFKGSLQWKNDLGLYFTLVLVMKIGMCDLMIFHLV